MKIAVFAAVALIAAGALTGCVSTRMNDGLNYLIGKPVQFVINRFGYPDSQREIMGHTLYEWSNEGGAMAVPLYGGGVFAARLQCHVEVAVDSRLIVTSYQWSGNNAGCAAFANRLPR